jgi:hypothetical protein
MDLVQLLEHPDQRVVVAADDALDVALACVESVHGDGSALPARLRELRFEAANREWAEDTESEDGPGGVEGQGGRQVGGAVEKHRIGIRMLEGSIMDR